MNNEESSELLQVQLQISNGIQSILDEVKEIADYITKGQERSDRRYDLLLNRINQVISNQLPNGHKRKRLVVDEDNEQEEVQADKQAKTV